MRLAPELDCLTHFVVSIWRSSFEREMGCRRLGRPNEGGNIKDDRSMPAQASLQSGKKTPHRCSQGVSQKKRVLRGVLKLETSGFKLKIINIKKHHTDAPRALELEPQGSESVTLPLSYEDFCNIRCT